MRALDAEIATGHRDAESPFAHSIAFNALPHIDVFDDAGWTREERKMIAETRKIMDLPNLHVVPTTVRVPVRVGHSEAVYAHFGMRSTRSPLATLLPMHPVSSFTMTRRLPSIHSPWTPKGATRCSSAEFARFPRTIGRSCSGSCRIT